MTLKNTTKEAKLHGGQCPFDAFFRCVSFSRFHLTRPKRGYLRRVKDNAPYHAGNLFAFRFGRRPRRPPAKAEQGNYIKTPPQIARAFLGNCFGELFLAAKVAKAAKVCASRSGNPIASRRANFFAAHAISC